MKHSLILLAAAALPACMCASASASGPGLRHVFDIHARCADAICTGDTPHGRRIMIPIVGGEVTGPGLNAVILPGGADYQLTDTAQHRTEFRAVYSVMTPDSAYINVENTGISFSRDGEYYFTTAPSFEADKNGPYRWLNDYIFICRPVNFAPGAVTLRVWQVL